MGGGEKMADEKISCVSPAKGPTLVQKEEMATIHANQPETKEVFKMLAKV